MQSSSLNTENLYNAQHAEHERQVIVRTLLDAYAHENQINDEDYYKFYSLLGYVTKYYGLVNKKTVKQEIKNIEECFEINKDKDSINCAVCMLLKKQLYNILGVYQYKEISTEITECDNGMCRSLDFLKD